ncbi:MAG: hypothetical protein ACI8TQ_002446 [Planctomycetota bacterium]|jgi:hypothetical protein
MLDVIYSSIVQSRATGLLINGRGSGKMQFRTYVGGNRRTAQA